MISSRFYRYLSGSSQQNRKDVLNQMDRVFRNHFLHFCVISLFVLLFSGCSSKQRATPPLALVSQSPALHSQRLLPVLGYAIQAGAFTEADTAFRFCSTLVEQGIAAYYFKENSGSYPVRFGSYRCYEEALTAARQLMQAGVIADYQIIRPETYPAWRYRDQEESIRKELVKVSQQFVGVPYRFGDVSLVSGFDCSGLSMMAYRLIGLDMPRISRDQFRLGRVVERDKLRPGDLVFFTTDRSGQVSHVGIYQGGDLFIHAPSRGKTVSRESLSSAYFQKHYIGARSYF